MVARPLGVVEAVVVDIDRDRAGFEIMAAAALFEARPRDDDLAVDAGVDAVRAAEPAVAATEAREGRAVDGQRGFGIVGGQNALLAVAEQAVQHIEVAGFEPDARAVAVGDAHILEHQPVNPRARAAQHQRGLALAGHAVEDRAAGFGGDKGDAPRGLHRAVAVIAGGDADRPLALADRIYRILQPSKAAAIDAIGRLAGLRGQRRRREEQRQGEQRQQGPTKKGFAMQRLIARFAPPVVCEGG